MKKVTMAVVTAAAIAASAIVPTGAAFAAPPPPHPKPLICAFFPTLNVCLPPKPPAPHHKLKKH
jgi:hypothetical protein